jgi:hypothetical protein
MPPGHPSSAPCADIWVDQGLKRHLKEVIPLACPICKSNDFYSKNPDDDYDMFEFTFENGRIQYEDGRAESNAPRMSEDPEIYCQRCAWHGKITSVQ